jgi:septal ring factor EnvC (AmiA/AmiB activator)
MVDASFSHQRAQEDRVAGVRRQLLIFAVALGVILIGIGYVLLQRGLADTPAGSPSAPVATAREAVSKEILETAKGLQATQQQAVDQLQIVQDQLVAQKEETRKLSEQITAVTQKLEALQRSVADIPAPAPVSPPKSR